MYKKIKGVKKVIVVLGIFILTLFTQLNLVTYATQILHDDNDVLILFEQKGKWGYIDEHGEIQINPIFDIVEDFSEGFAVVGFYNEDPEDRNLLGYINKSGEFIFGPYPLCMAKPFSEGLAVIESYFNFSYINSKGEIVLEFVAEIAGSFSEGLAMRDDELGRVGYINKQGDWIIAPRYLKGGPFKEGLAAVIDYESRKYGFIDSAGKVLIPFEFEYASDFSEGYSRIYEGRNRGYINKSGEIIIKPSSDIGTYSEGLITISKDKKFGFMDINSNIVIEPFLEQASYFTEGLAYAKVDGKYGYMNKEGEMVIQPIYDYCKPFHNGLAYVVIGKKSGFIDKTGKMVFEY